MLCIILHILNLPVGVCMISGLSIEAALLVTVRVLILCPRLGLVPSVAILAWELGRLMHCQVLFPGRQEQALQH